MRRIQTVARQLTKTEWHVPVERDTSTFFTRLFRCITWATRISWKLFWMSHRKFAINIEVSRQLSHWVAYIWRHLINATSLWFPSVQINFKQTEPTETKTMRLHVDKVMCTSGLSFIQAIGSCSANFEEMLAVPNRIHCSQWDKFHSLHCETAVLSMEFYATMWINNWQIGIDFGTLSPFHSFERLFDKKSCRKKT